MQSLETDIDIARPPKRQVIEKLESSTQPAQAFYFFADGGPAVESTSAGSLFWVRMLPSGAPRLIRQEDVAAFEPDRIEQTHGVCGGAARIAGTRIPVWALVRFRQLGASDDDLLAFYPSLTPKILARAWEYEASHVDEIAAQILQNETA